jgi:hypothetical protein
VTLEAIREAIKRKLAGWFEGMEEAAWDEDFERDFAPGGRGEALAKEIQREISEGKAQALPSDAGPIRECPFGRIPRDPSYAARHHA